MIFFLFPGNISFKNASLVIFVLAIMCRSAILSFLPSEGIIPFLFEDKPIREIKILMAIFDIGTLLILIELLEKRKLDIRWACLYAFNPLILYSFSGQGHFDVMMIFFLLASVYCHDKKYFVRMFILIGISVQIKDVSFLALPFLVNRDNCKWLPISIIVVMLPFLPFLHLGWQPVFFKDLFGFGSDDALNGSIHNLILLGVNDIRTATRISGILFCLFFLATLYVWYLDKKKPLGHDPVQGIFIAFGAFILFSPTLHFWYLSWILPFAILRMNGSWIFLSLFLCICFPAIGISHPTEAWALPWYFQTAGWLLFYILFSFEAYFFSKRIIFYETFLPPETLSVVIPSKNESKRIEMAIKSIRQDPAVNEIIVVDAGSSDNTRDIAAKEGATVILNDHLPENGGGRGGQIFSGVKAATGDVVAIVHADTLVISPVFTRILTTLSAHPDIAGGSVGGKFDKKGPFMTWIELMNAFRSVFLKISFGDQIQFFRREPVLSHHLFPNIPLMEDVELSIRLNTIGRQIFLFGDTISSARRWQTRGAPNSLVVVVFVFRYLFQRLIKPPDTVTMYYTYYKKEHDKIEGKSSKNSKIDV
ncbi:MAG: glycosyltransferase [Proteobacteria bacterium]|nr:glycosyltransferase [Pseudomonadota bacterium]